jgi:hypothetical protein
MKKRKHIMRVYAGIISVIAIVSIAANISFGYYLYAFEQLNRQLQRQIVNFQQDQADDAQQIYALDTALRVNRSYVRHLTRQLRDQSLVLARQLAPSSTRNVPWCSRQLQGEYTHTHITPQQVGRRIQTAYTAIYNATVDDMTYTRTWPHDLLVTVAVTHPNAETLHTDTVALTSTRADAARRDQDVRIIVTTRCVYVVTR